MTETARVFSAPAPRTGERQQLREEVATYVRELIMSGGVRPGEFLRMERIAEAVGVSNTPVREGLLTLRNEGVVRLVPNRGFLVESFSPQDVHDLFWAQAQLAGELAGRAARNVTPELLQRLEALIEAEGRAQKSHNTDLIAEGGHAFHREINRAADSPRLAHLLASMVQQLPNRFYATIDSRVEDAGDVHPQLLAAFRKKDAKKATALMQKHIESGAEHLIGELEKRGIWDGEQA